MRDFIDHLCAQSNRSGEPLAPADTIRWIMAPLKAMLADAYENGLVTVDASRVRVVVSDRGRARTLKPASKRLAGEQTTAILAAIPERYRLLFLLLACTGLRISEALGLHGRTSSRPLPGQCSRSAVSSTAASSRSTRRPRPATAGWPSCRTSPASSSATAPQPRARRP